MIGHKLIFYTSNLYSLPAHASSPLFFRHKRFLLGVLYLVSATVATSLEAFCIVKARPSKSL